MGQCASSGSCLSAGHVINLVSSDLQRIDEAVGFWVFLVAGPLELIMVSLHELRMHIYACMAGLVWQIFS